MALFDVLERASSGEREIVGEFLALFLQSQVIVPDRYQAVPLSHQPPYPSDVFALLGMSEADRTSIPCFTSQELLQEWANQKLQFSTVSGSNLCSRAPEGWWIVLNPGSENSKEFSPWEIAKLRQGTEAIPEIVHDLAQQEPMVSFEVAPLDIRECPTLVDAIVAAAQTESTIDRLFLARQWSVTGDGDRFSTILVGFVAPVEVLDQARELLESAAEICQIGDEQVTVLGAAQPNALQLSIFSDINPFWQRPARSPLAIAWKSAQSVFEKLLPRRSLRR